MQPKQKQLLIKVGYIDDIMEIDDYHMNRQLINLPFLLHQLKIFCLLCVLGLLFIMFWGFLRALALIVPKIYVPSKVSWV
jgi:hypothetical protein